MLALARHCVILTSLCASLAVLVVCVFLFDPPQYREHGNIRIRTLALCIFCNGPSAAVNLLNLAFYPRHAVVNLFVVSSAPVAEPLWLHGQFRRVPGMPLYDGSDCLVLLDDTMEVSPVYIFWFIRKCDRPVVSGGDSGLALSGGVWRTFANESGKAILSYGDAVSEAVRFISRSNTTVVYPNFEGYTFVRSLRQSPIQPERPPKLARGMDAAFFALG